MNKSDIPDAVETELGSATIGVVKPHNAIKPYICPLCDEEIDFQEEHLIVVPIVKSRLRRHVHTDCLTIYIEQDLTIKLHPNEPNIAKYHF
jgi:hypothetical protein